MLIEFGAEEFPEKEFEKKALEKRQVASSDSRGLGFNWAEISKLSYAGRTLVSPEQRLAVWNLQAYEKVNFRLGYADFLKQASAYRVYKRFRGDMGFNVKSFWEWLAR